MVITAVSEDLQEISGLFLRRLQPSPEEVLPSLEHHGLQYYGDRTRCHSLPENSLQLVTQVYIYTYRYMYTLVNLR